MKAPNILKYLFSCFLLILPPLLMSIFSSQLPRVWQTEVFQKDIPPVIAYGEQIFRTLLIFLAVFMPLNISTQKQKVGLAIYLIGAGSYILSWILLIKFPQSDFSTSFLGLTSLAYLPVIWFAGIGMIGDSFFFPVRYRSWFYILITCIFGALHISHAVLVYSRTL
jgi:hypothetical protein